MARWSRWLLWGALLSLLALVLVKGVWPAFGVFGDFANYYTAAAMAARGDPIEPAYRDFTYFQKEMDRSGIDGQLGGFIPHPPTAALLFLPLTPFGPVTAKAVWTILSLGLAALCVWLLSRLAELDWLTVATLFLATGYGLVNNLLFGQLYLLLLASILLGLELARRDRPLGAGVCLGLLTPIKYAAGVYILYMAWKRNWTVVAAAAATVAALTAASLFVFGVEAWETFFRQVLPRHLAGEIQDPFATRFQSWNSLLRRLLVAEPTLNPAPALDAPWLFFLFKNAFFWSVAGLSCFLISTAEFPTQRQREMFRLGLLPAAVLLASPAGATYHFLLLTLTAVLFVKILLDQKRVPAAVGVGILFSVVNLPHYFYLETLAEGWTTPLAYSRLWLLICFLTVSLVLFRSCFRKAELFSRWATPILTAILASTAVQWYVQSQREGDAASPLRVFDPADLPRLGYNLTQPDVGLKRLVFVAPEADRQRYGVFSDDGGRWAPVMSRNFFNPGLAGDDAHLAVETVADGRTEIWVSRQRGAFPTFLTVGERPSWSLDGRTIAWSRGDRLLVSNLESGAESEFAVDGEISGLALSPSAGRLAYTRRNTQHELRLIELDTGMDRGLAAGGNWIGTPGWSPSEQTLLFAQRRGANVDIYALELSKGSILRLTRHPGSDQHPVWDAVANRIVFVSDRGRGLGFNALYQIGVPASLR